MTVIIFIYKKLKTTNQIPCKLTKKTTKSIKNSKIWYFCVLMLRYKLVVLTETEPPLSYQSKHEVRIRILIILHTFVTNQLIFHKTRNIRNSSSLIKPSLYIFTHLDKIYSNTSMVKPFS